MPRPALRICLYPGCPEFVVQGYCEKHTRERNAATHDKKSHRLYGTKAWAQRRAAQLAAEPWCEECLKQGVYNPATDVDHIEPHQGDPARFFTGKLQSLCHSHHSSKTAREVMTRVGGSKKSTR